MTVKELISRLEGCDPDAQVYVLTQPNWPFENACEGVIERWDFEEAPDEDAPVSDKWGSDVMILQGEQVRYGSPKAWG